MNNVLKSFGFGQQFIQWFNVLYNNACSCVLNNGNFSEFFQLGRSCRQGDPLSPYLFILAIEPLSVEIKKNKKIKGIVCGKEIIKIGLYADDTFLMLDGSESSLQESVLVLNHFQVFSGLKINLDKTQAIWLGKLKKRSYTICKDLNLNWDVKFKLLGINFSVNLDEMNELNYRIKIAEIEKLFTLYKRFHLSLVGKITVIKTMAIPKLVYLFTVLPTPDTNIMDKIERIISDFLWEGKARVARTFLEKDINEGGLKLTNVKLFNYALKLTWVKRILVKNGDWQTIFQVNVNTLNRKSCFELDIESLKLLQGKFSNAFWKDVFAAWVAYKTDFCDKIDPRTYPIWDTYYITNSNLRKRSKELQNIGIKYLNDLISLCGGLFGYDEFIRTFNLQMNFVDFYSLMHSIPRKWKRDLNERLDKQCVYQEVIDSLLKMRKVCKESYSYMLSKDCKHRSHESKWCQVLQTHTRSFPWHEYYSCNFQCTVDSKMRAFQYKILLRIIPTNKYLKMCKITDNESCYFCNNDIESIEHLFYFCPIVKDFWVKLAERIKPHLDITSYLQPQNVLLGYLGIENRRCLNHLFNIVKRYIYSTKCNGNRLCLEYLEKIIKQYYTIENNLVHMCNKSLEIFKKKWQPLEPMFE